MVSLKKSLENYSVQIVTGSKMFDHVTPFLKRLQWLLVKSRIHFKIYLMTFKCFHGKGPAYHSAMPSPYKPRRTVRSGSQCLLKDKSVRLKTVGDLCYQVASSKLWNNLPEYLREGDGLEEFKKGLKTYLFILVYE